MSLPMSATLNADVLLVHMVMKSADTHFIAYLQLSVQLLSAPVLWLPW